MNKFFVKSTLAVAMFGLAIVWVHADHEKMSSTMTTSTTTVAVDSNLRAQVKSAVMQRVERISNERLMMAQTRVASLLEDYSASNFRYYWVLEEVKMAIDAKLGMDMEMMTIAQLAMNTESLSTLAMIVEDLDLWATLMSEGPFTVFAPSNDAFAKALCELDLEYSELASMEEALRDIVLYHVLPMKVSAKQAMALSNGTKVATATTDDTDQLTVMSTDSEVMVDQATVVMADVMASNGVVHVIDSVLLPSSLRMMLGLESYDMMEMSSECMNVMADDMSDSSDMMDSNDVMMDDNMDSDVSGGVSSVS